ncbi:hypothetical protein HanIR_Chr17g0895011 [Helianthus annuus]|nr:hypothetical protein HanIR_Chr17g0895011 [Helianthus annuus]
MYIGIDKNLTTNGIRVRRISRHEWRQRRPIDQIELSPICVLRLTHLKKEQ